MEWCSFCLGLSGLVVRGMVSDPNLLFLLGGDSKLSSQYRRKEAQQQQKHVKNMENIKLAAAID